MILTYTVGLKTGPTFSSGRQVKDIDEANRIISELKKDEKYSNFRIIDFIQRGKKVL